MPKKDVPTLFTKYLNMFKCPIIGGFLPPEYELLDFFLTSQLRKIGKNLITQLIMKHVYVESIFFISHISVSLIQSGSSSRQHPFYPGTLNEP